MTHLVDENTHYAILTNDGVHTIIQKKRTNSDTYEILVPDAGSATTAHKILKWFREYAYQLQVSAAQREQEWKELLNKPHSFLKESAKSLNCHCGALLEDAIHTSGEEE